MNKNNSNLLILKHKINNIYIYIPQNILSTIHCFYLPSSRQHKLLISKKKKKREPKNKQFQ